MVYIRNFFWFCSGMCPSLLKRCPTDTSKYTGMGATVFFTGLLAALSAGYALYTIFDSVWSAVIFGLVWGCMIFNLDRFIISSMRKCGSFRREFRIAIPRLILAVLLALVISKPLELKIFEKEINRQIDIRKNEEVVKTKTAIATGFPEIAEIENRIAALKTEVSEKEAFRNQRQQEYDDERFGEKTRGTTGVPGIGTNARKREIQLDAAEEDLKTTTIRNLEKIDRHEQEIAALTASKNTEFDVQKINIDKYDGLAARMEALGQLAEESSVMWLANIFIILLFIAIETSPVIVKLISGRGPYDDLLEVHEHGFRNYRVEQISKSNHQTNKRLNALTEAETPEEIQLTEAARLP